MSKKETLLLDEILFLDKYCGRKNINGDIHHFLGYVFLHKEGDSQYDFEKYKLPDNIIKEIIEFIENERTSKSLLNLETWLKLHNVKKVGDTVYDGQGIIFEINKDINDCYIKINPINWIHNLGNGYGNIIKIIF